MEGTDPQTQQVLFQQIPQDQTAPLPQQQGYAPEKGYPTQEEYKNGPPPYFFSQQQPYPTNTTAVPAAQQQPHNLIIVQSQPTPVVKATTIQRVTGDHYLTLSIVLTFLCFFVGSWYSLFCTIPAIILAISARDHEKRGDVEGAKSKARVALILNIVSIVFWVIVIIIIIIVSSVAATTASSGYNAPSYYSPNCYYYTRYSSRLGYRSNSGIRYRSNSGIRYRSSSYYYSYYYYYSRSYYYYYSSSYYYYYTTYGYYTTTTSGSLCSK